MPASTPSERAVVTLYTIGHSTRPWEEFLAVLQAHAIQTLVDIRAFPASRRFPQFGKDKLKEALEKHKISYRWMPALGGHRPPSLDPSPNTALRSQAFRNYADYMLSPEFVQAARELVSLAEASRTACLCAEKHYQQCHRRLVSDWLAASGYTVLHMIDSSPAVSHEMTSEARLEGDRLIYRGDRLF
jgi:uncharacterized protein (DUF488 family)